MLVGASIINIYIYIYIYTERERERESTYVYYLIAATDVAKWSAKSAQGSRGRAKGEAAAEEDVTSQTTTCMFVTWGALLAGESSRPTCQNS